MAESGHSLTARVTTEDSSSAVGPDDEQRLVARCQEGQEGAFEEMYRLYAPQVYRHLYTLLGEDAIEDALQRVFEQAFRSISRFAGRSKLSTWLHGIAINVSRNARRSRKRRQQAMTRLRSLAEQGERPEISGDSGIDRRLDGRKQMAELYGLLEGLRPKRREAFILYYIEELELREVAARLQVSTAAAWARVQRGRDEIVAALRKRDGEPG